MRIAAAEVFPYRLPFAAEYVTARGRLSRRELVLLRLVDEEGREGWGEAVPLALRGGAEPARVAADLEAWARRAREPAGDPPRFASAGDLEGLPPPARCAALTALADLEARRADLPLWRFLGAVRPVPVPCNATLVSGPAAAVAADAERWAAAGFSTFKLKVGLKVDGPVGGRGAGRRGGEPDPDLSQIEAVREAVGDTARIRLDANGAWTVDRAEAVLRAAAPLGIELVEQPVATLEEMAELHRRLHHPHRFAPRRGKSARRRAAIPIAADESVNGPAEARAARDAAACDLATVKLAKVGRLLPDLDGALPFYLSSALDGPVGIAAAAHAYQALALPPLAQGLATQRLFAATIAARECELRGAELILPEGPGLGVEIDRDRLAAHRL